MSEESVYPKIIAKERQDLRRSALQVLAGLREQTAHLAEVLESGVFPPWKIDEISATCATLRALAVRDDGLAVLEFRAASVMRAEGNGRGE